MCAAVERGPGLCVPPAVSARGSLLLGASCTVHNCVGAACGGLLCVRSSEDWGRHWLRVAVARCAVRRCSLFLGLLPCRGVFLCTHPSMRMHARARSCVQSGMNPLPLSLWTASCVHGVAGPLR